jgi:hypothetical protein
VVLQRQAGVRRREALLHFRVVVVAGDKIVDVRADRVGTVNSALARRACYSHFSAFSTWLRDFIARPSVGNLLPADGKPASATNERFWADNCPIEGRPQSSRPTKNNDFVLQRYS